MFDLKELLSIQKQFGDSIQYLPTPQEYILALNVEIAELLNLLPWKWWKKTYTMDKTKILDEMADVLAFWLSYYNLFFEKHHATVLLPTDQVVEHEKEQLQRSIMNEIGREMDKDKTRKLNVQYISFEDQFTMVQFEVAGRRLGRLIGIVMTVTDTKLEDIVAAYKTKMEVNWSRQKNHY
jgi:dimeric dUTPase (all-alpha-NTP-PPase superfamily)